MLILSLTQGLSHSIKIGRIHLFKCGEMPGNTASDVKFHISSILDKSKI